MKTLLDFWALHKNRSNMASKCVVFGSLMATVACLLTGCGSNGSGTSGNALRIVDVTSCPAERIWSQDGLNITARIHNTGRKSAELFIGHAGGPRVDKEELEWQRENTRGFEMLYGLGIEAKWTEDSSWQAHPSIWRWMPAGESADAFDPPELEATLEAGETRSFTIRISMPGPKSYRVYLLNPDLERYDEMVHTP